MKKFAARLVAQQTARPVAFAQVRLMSSVMKKPTMFASVFAQSSVRSFSAAPEDEPSQQLSDSEIIELVEGKIFEVLKSAAKCDHSKLSRTATFEELGFDSLDGVELVLALEEHFGIDLVNEEAEKINTVMDAIQIFHSQVLQRLNVEVKNE
uniref:Acyl carrier protein n=1 Tax=Strombidium rassoulzadegani TaxID=1082188 RepID=A0A7S3CKG9_9SPIT|mmetsp:Transcript_14358/g.24447  ORF Transcript_14358/g.24447 Transcript_14358/m.24447 type:complete len:152 (+) Transcript_14358:33-488(+)